MLPTITGGKSKDVHNINCNNLNLLPRENQKIETYESKNVYLNEISILKVEMWQPQLDHL